MKKLKKKCLLLSVPAADRILPRGILSIASFLEIRGYPTEVIPLAYYLNFRNDWSYQDIEKILDDFIRLNEPVAIGVSCQITAYYPICVEILKICKQLRDDIVTVIGGPFATFMDKECITSPFIDVVVRGEGEWTMLELMSSVERKTELHKVNGITFKDKNEIFQTPDRILGDLNELPNLNFGILPFEFVQKAEVYGMLSRGCAFHCSFCSESIFWKKLRTFSSEIFIQEIKLLYRTYKNYMAAIGDSMVYIGSERFSEVCAEIKKQKIPVRPDFHALSRVDTINEQGLNDIRETGIQTVCMGIESGSPKVLKMMNKKISREQIISTCGKLRENNLKPLGFWMIGHPGDNPEEAECSFEFFRELLQKELLWAAHVCIFDPDVGTPFFQQPEKYGIQILTYDWTQWSQDDKAICQLEDFSAADILKYYRKAVELIEINKEPDEG